jgi:ribose transport system substrate-binding protein
MSGRRLAMLGVVVLAGVASLAAGLAASGRAGDRAVKANIAFFNPVAANAFTASAWQGIQYQAKLMHASVTSFDAGFDQNKQISQIQDAIVTKKYNAFVIIPVNGAVLVQPTKQAIKAGIKVVAAFNGIGPNLNSIKPQVPGMTAVVGQQLSQNGALLGQWIVKACGTLNPCTVAYMPGSFKQGTEIIRLHALNAVLAPHTNIKTIETAEGGYLAAPALKAATDVLQAHPNVNVFATSGDQMMTGIISAVKNAHLFGKIKLIGNGTTIEGVSWVRQGIVLADPVALPYFEGTESTKLVVQALNGQKVPSSINELLYSPVGPVATKATLSTAAGKKFKGEYHG